ncbi:MAG: shikimate dehydrogenase [Candidatus Bathyarchaeota archaeon]
MRINGKTNICAIIGDPIKHSLSPVMHNAAFEELDLNFVYVAFTVKVQNLKAAILGAKSLGIRGLNITMPHKNAVIKYLDNLDSVAKSINAVNTVSNQKGKLIGYNTDGSGVTLALKENQIYPEKKKLVLLGAGGAAKAIAHQVSQDVKELVILNRTIYKAKKLAEMLKNSGIKINARILSPNVLMEELSTADLLINATSVGMNPDAEKSPVPSEYLRSDLDVMDIVYNPTKTRLLKDAEAVGARIVSGLEMLIYQGAIAFEIWTGYQAPIKVMRTAILDQLNKKRAAP